MSNINAALITGVLGIGTNDGDELAFVQCEFHDGQQQALAFSPDIGATLVSSFSSALAHVQMKQAMRGKGDQQFIPVPVNQFKVAAGMDSNGNPSILILATTIEGANLQMVSSKETLLQLRAELDRSLASLDNPQLPN